MTYAQMIENLADSNGVVKARIETETVRERLSRDIYSNPYSGFRELYANECRACRAARKQFEGNAHIDIILDHSNRNLIIQGIESLGIPLQKFVDVLAVLGESDNQSGTEVGQFGMGHLSFRALSDNIIFESFSRETGEKFSYIGNGSVYERLPEPSLNAMGTRVTVTLRDSIDIRQLSSYITRTCLYSEVDTYLTVLDEDGNVKEDTHQINTPDIRGSLEGLGTLVEADEEDYYLCGVLQDGGRDLIERKDHSILLLRIPIEAEIELPFSTWVLNIKNERRYMPTADRERLTEDAQNAIAQELKLKLKEAIAPTLNIKTLDDFRNSKCRALYFNLNHAYKNLVEALLNLYTPSEETKEIAKIVNVGVRVNDSQDGKAKTSECKLGDLILQSRNLFYSPSVAKEYEHVLRQEYPDAVVFKFDRSWQKECLPILKKYGIRDDTYQEYLRVRAELGRVWRDGMQVTPRSSPGLPQHITVHRSCVGSEEHRGERYYRLVRKSDSNFSTAALASDPERIIFTENLEEYLSILNEVDSSYMLSKMGKHIPNTHSLEHFIQKLHDEKVETSLGQMTFNEIIRSNLTIRVLIYPDPRLARAYKPEGTIFIPIDDDTAFRLAVYCRYHDRRYHIRYVVSGNEFQEVTGSNRWNYFNRTYYTYAEMESHEPDKMTVANCVFHVAAAVSDKNLVGMYLAAERRQLNIEAAQSNRDFLLQLWEARLEDADFSQRVEGQVHPAEG